MFYFIMFNCSYCAEMSATSFKKLLRHIKFIHSHQPNFSVSCRHCHQTFQKFESFKSHLRRKHSEDNERDAINGDGFVQDGGIIDDHDEIEAEGEISDELEGNEELETGQDSVETMTRFIALFILKTKEENQLSQHVMNSVLHNTENLVEQSLETKKWK